LPGDYPTTDFYGQPVIGGGAAGAVQAVTPINYSYLGLSVNNSLAGSISTVPEPDADGMVPNGSVILMANHNSGYVFVHWLQGGVQTVASPYTLTISGHTFIQAVFSRTVTVNDLSDDPGSASRITLRYALATAQNGDIITFSAVTPGTTAIALESSLPRLAEHISVVIEGEGITLARAPSWTANGSALSIDENTDMTIRRVHFKDGLAREGAIHQRGGTLTLESCIFSNNSYAGTSTSLSGGAIVSAGPLTIRGCTFYANRAGYGGGAVYFASSSSTLTLTGNLFYGNTGNINRPVINVRYGNLVSSYNLVDAAFGTGDGECGWTPAGTGDATFASMSITGSPIDTATFAPVSGLLGVLPAAAPADFPALDFYGATRTFPGAPGAVAASP
jgi:hypothetical protein